MAIFQSRFPKHFWLLRQHRCFERPKEYLQLSNQKNTEQNQTCRNLLIIPNGTTSNSAMTKRMSTPTSTASLGFAWSIDREWKEKITKRKIRNESIVRCVQLFIFAFVHELDLHRIWIHANADWIQFHRNSQRFPYFCVLIPWISDRDWFGRWTKPINASKFLSET